MGLDVRDLTVRFGATTAVDHVDLAVPSGSVVAVLGPSGCGKSTLLRAVAGLEDPATGTVAFDGQDLAGVPTHRRGFALMFQDGQLFPQLSVGRNVAYPLRLRRTPRAATAARVAELLELVGLSGFADRLPTTLSGGERQRVALARALAAAPRLLLLDEPLSALDAGLRQRLAEDLRRILVESGTTSLMVTHDHEEAFAVADDLAVMRAGRIVQSGPIAEVWRAPADPETALFLGYARVVPEEGGKKIYEITDEGRKYLAEHSTTVNDIFERIAKFVGGFTDAPMMELNQSFQRLARATYKTATSHISDKEKIQKIREIIQRAAEEIEATVK